MKTVSKRHDRIALNECVSLNWSHVDERHCSLIKLFMWNVDGKVRNGQYNSTILLMFICLFICLFIWCNTSPQHGYTWLLIFKCCNTWTMSVSLSLQVTHCCWCILRWWRWWFNQQGMNWHLRIPSINIRIHICQVRSWYSWIFIFNFKHNGTLEREESKIF